MKIIADFFTLMVTAIFVENAVLSRGLGMSRMIRLPLNNRERTRFSLLVIVITTISSILCWFAQYFIREHEYVFFIRPMLFIVCISAVYLSVYFISKKFMTKIFEEIKGDLAMAAFNCTVFGTVLIGAQTGVGFLQMLGFGIGSGIGYLLAVLLVCQVRRRLQLCDVPKAFDGFPITLIYIGLLSLALYGLIGHQLPM